MAISIVLRRTVVIALLVVCTCGVAAAAGQVAGVRGQISPEPIPHGQRIDARDGDLIVVEDGARVRIVRRNRAVVRAIFNPNDRWLVLLVDKAPRGGTPDGGVDVSYTFNGLTGEWPLEQRWQGEAFVDEYSTADELRPSFGLGVHSPQGLIQFLNPSGERDFRDPTAVAVLSYRGSGSGGGGGSSFDEAERLQVANAARNATAQSRLPQGISTSTYLGVVTGGVGWTASGASQDNPAPLRVGGSIRQPRKIVDAAPIYPDAGRRAGIVGTVILEITIGTDGAVTDARVLRSIPLLDDAAIDTVRKWRYQPVLLNGNPVPIIMTVPLTFMP
jgi:TonB family protein